VAPSKEVPGKLGTFTSQMVEANVFITVYAGKVYALDDPNLPKDKTYQQIIPGTKRVIDASHFPTLGTGYHINQTFIDAKINVRAYACSKSPKVIINLPVLIYYSIVETNKNIVLYKTLVRMAANIELLTGYGRNYW